jgi:hypothetical protein
MIMARILNTNNNPANKKTGVPVISFPGFSGVRV